MLNVRNTSSQIAKKHKLRYVQPKHIHSFIHSIRFNSAKSCNEWSRGKSTIHMCVCVHDKRIRPTTNCKQNQKQSYQFVFPFDCALQCIAWAAAASAAVNNIAPITWLPSNTKLPKKCCGVKKTSTYPSVQPVRTSIQCTHTHTHITSEADRPQFICMKIDEN